MEIKLYGIRANLASLLGEEQANYTDDGWRLYDYCENSDDAINLDGIAIFIDKAKAKSNNYWDKVEVFAITEITSTVRV